MSEKDNGGTAFPLHPGIEPSWKESRGMSLRDYIAIKAMAANLTKVTGDASSFREVGELVSRASYIIADEMLKERNK